MIDIAMPIVIGCIVFLCIMCAQISLKMGRINNLLDYISDREKQNARLNKKILQRLDVAIDRLNLLADEDFDLQIMDLSHPKAGDNNARRND